MVDYYGTLAASKTYHAARTNPEWAAASDADLLAALLIASEWIDARYRSKFPGVQYAGRSQVRAWPRSGAVDVDGWSVDPLTVPPEIENATYEAALREIITPGSLSVDFNATKNIKSVSIDGALSVTYTGATDAYSAQIVIPAVDSALSKILTGYGASSIAGQSYRA